MDDLVVAHASNLREEPPHRCHLRPHSRDNIVAVCTARRPNGRGRTAMSDIVFSTQEFTIAAGATLPMQIAFNGSVAHGGDNVGPIVVNPNPVALMQSLHISTATTMRLRVDSGGLTSRTLYLFRVTNQNNFHVRFSLEAFISD
jgi:hypothetical protein